MVAEDLVEYDSANGGFIFNEIFPEVEKQHINGQDNFVVEDIDSARDSNSQMSQYIDLIKQAVKSIDGQI